MKKKLFLAVLGAAAVGASQAEALYHDAVLRTGAAYTFRIADGLTGTQVRLQSITRGRLELEDSRVVAPGALADIPFSIPGRATRILLVLDVKCTPASCGDATVTVLDANNNPIAPAVTSDGSHFEVGFDVAPAAAARGDGRPTPARTARGEAAGRAVVAEGCNCRLPQCSKVCAVDHGAPSPATDVASVLDGSAPASGPTDGPERAADRAALFEGCNCRIPACSQYCAAERRSAPGDAAWTPVAGM
jgi:hypothetical protein